MTADLSAYDPDRHEPEGFITSIYWDAWWARSELGDAFSEPDPSTRSFIATLHHQIVTTIQGNRDLEWPRPPEPVSDTESAAIQLSQIELWCERALASMGTSITATDRYAKFARSSKWVSDLGEMVRRLIREQPGSTITDIQNHPDVQPWKGEGIGQIKEYVGWLCRERNGSHFRAYREGERTSGIYMNREAFDIWTMQKHFDLRRSNYKRWLDEQKAARSLPYGYRMDLTT